MSLVAHAIGRALVDPPLGLDGAALLPVGTAGLVLWVSERAGDLGRDDAIAHHAIVEELCRRGPCLPVRFGTRFADAAAATASIAARADALAAMLDRVGSRRELAVTLLWADSSARGAQGKGPLSASAQRERTPRGGPYPRGRGHAAAADERPPAVPGGPGTRYLRAARQRTMADEARREAAQGLAERLAGELSIDQADVRHAICPTADVALSTAILAPAGKAEQLKEEAVRSASRLPGVRAVVSGPWPPYSFAGLS